jgi:hypothetical protein
MILRKSDSGRVVFFRLSKKGPLLKGVTIRVNPRTKTLQALVGDKIQEVKFRMITVVNGREGDHNPED